MGRIKHIVINKLTKHLLKALTEDDILQMTNEGYLVNGRKLTVGEMRQLEDEAKELQGSYLWKLMTRELEFHAFRRMSDQARTDGDIVFGKAMFYNLSLLRRFLKNLSGE